VNFFNRYHNLILTVLYILATVVILLDLLVWRPN